MAITELDIANAGSDDYWRAADACMNVSKCVGITTWGVGDVVRNLLSPLCGIKLQSQPTQPARKLEELTLLGDLGILEEE